METTMDVILIDLVDNNRVVEGSIQDDATAHSLSSLVSSDDSTCHSAERKNTDSPAKNWENRQRRRHVSRTSGAEISIIASSSPEIKRLVEPSSVPKSVQCRHQRSVSTLSFFPEDNDHDTHDFCGSFSAPITRAAAPPIPKLRRNSCPVVVVSPDNAHHATRRLHGAADRIPLSIDHRDEESWNPEDRFLYDDEPTPRTRNSSHKDAIDELTLCLAYQRIESNPVFSPEFDRKKKIPDSSSHPHQNKKTIRAPQERRIKKRSGMHRRVSYENLPDMSEVLCHPDFLSTNET